MATARTTTVPAPVGGLNDRDALAAMPASDAVIMVNWWPEPSRLMVRKGFLRHTDGELPAAVESLFEYHPPSGSIKLFAAAGDSIYDVTTFGQAGSSVASGKTNARWQTATATTAGGSFLYAFNGADKALLYNGTTWDEIDDQSSPVNITGVDTKDIVDGVVFKNRLYLIEKGSMNLWYLPATQIGGTASAIDMGLIFQRGGRIITAKTWTIDSGAGQDDHFVVISSNGEVAVFAGYDPSDATAWALVGLFYLGRPVGQRCAIKFGGDLLIICEDGIFPLGRGLLMGETDRRVAITDKIQNTLREQAMTYKAAFGWQLTLASDASMLLLNVPNPLGNVQYAQNTITGSWAKFEGMDAVCWLYSELGLFYGGKDGTIYRAWIATRTTKSPSARIACKRLALLTRWSKTSGSP